MEELQKAIQENIPKSLQEEFYEYLNNPTEEKKEELVNKMANDKDFNTKWRNSHTPWKRIKKIGRNDLCPCGSGLKYKKCTCEEYHNDATIGWVI